MSFSLKNFALAAVAAATLAACGGGGGSDAGSAPAPTKMAVKGQAAKGALSGALVVAQVWDGSKWADIEGAQATTDANGNFELSYPEQSGTVRLHVKHQAGAKMFNEATQKLEDMPTGLALNSFLVNPTTNNINAYTELAFVAAHNDYSPASIEAAMAVAKALAGKPANEVASTSSEATPQGNQHDEAMKALLNAVGPECDAACAVGKLTENAAQTLNRVEGKVSFNPDNFGDFYQNIAGLGVVSEVQKQQLQKELEAIDITQQSEGGEAFDKFVQNLRSSFLQLQNNFSSTEQTLQQRYSNLTTHGTMSIAQSVKDMLNNCAFWEVNGNAECFEEEGWSTTDGKNYTKSYTNPQGVNMLVTASGVLNSNSFSVRYIAEQKKDGKVFEKADLTLTSSGINIAAEDIEQMLGKTIKMTLNGSVDKVAADGSSTTKFTVKDLGMETSGVTLSQTNSGNVHLNANGSTFKLHGEIGFSSNLGDSGSGVLTATLLNKVVGNADDTVPVVEKLEASLQINAKDVALQSTKLNLVGNFTPAEASSNGFATLNLNAYAKVDNGDVVKFDLSRTLADKAAASLTVGVGSNAIVAKVDALQTQLPAAQALPDYCFEVEQKFFCAQDLNLSSSDGRFKAVVKANTLQGDLTYNGTKFGEISKSGITYDGKKYSFY